MRSSSPESRPRPRRLLLVLMTLTAAGQAPQPAAAQQRDVFLEVGASQVLPPTGVTGDGAKFLVGGIRGTWLSDAGSGVLGSFLAGRATNGAAGGHFLSAETVAAGWLKMGGDWSVGLRGRALGFWVGSPFPYWAGAMEAGPSVRLLRPNLSVRVDGTAGLGRSRIEFESVTLQDGTWEHRGHMGDRWEPSQSSVSITTLETDLWRYGGSAEVLARMGPVITGAAGGVHRTAAGTFRSAGLRVLGGGSRVQLGVRLDVWWTPYARETTGGLTVVIPVGEGWSIRGFLGRSEPDPLTLATSSGGGGGVLLGRRVGGRGTGGGSPPLHEVLARSTGVARVRFSVQVPPTAEAVELVGDFTLWEPRRMERVGEEWILDLEISEGLHHFGFIVDGTWYIPSDARDTVPDEWGRRSVTLLVEPLLATSGGSAGL